MPRLWSSTKLSDHAPSATMTECSASSRWKYSISAHRLLGDDRQAIYEQLGRNESAVQEHSVLRRDQQVARRDAVGQRPRLETDRLDIAVALGAPPGIATPADPFERHRRAGQGDQPIADAEVFDGDLPPIRPDQRAPEIAGRRRIVDQGVRRWNPHARNTPGPPSRKDRNRSSRHCWSQPAGRSRPE